MTLNQFAQCSVFGTLAALRDLYLVRTEGSEPTESDIYRIFLNHTPLGLKDKVHDLYARLHVGPAADTDP